MQTIITRTEAPARLVGKPLKRKEDPRFLIGSSRYVDDMKLPGTLHAYVVRSTYAHARIESINLEEALSYPGVRRIYTSAEVDSQVTTLPIPGPSDNRRPVPRPPLARGVVNYIGEPVAFVVAESRYIAEDAAELVEVNYSPLPNVIDPEAAMKPDSPPVHEGLNTNVGEHFVREGGNVEEAFKSADRIVKVEIVNQRVAPAPMESRAVFASYDPGIDYLTVWMSNQQPFETKVALAETLHLDENKIRVVAPDVGGAFGAKCYLYPEDAMACIASMDLRMPVKWIETRSENLATMFHGRGQNQTAEVAVKNDGTILGLKVKIISDSGAYASPETFGDPEVTIDMIPALYDIKNYRGELYCVYTNKVSFDAYRGAGRPEATYFVERIIDRISRELGIDPTELRLKNFIKQKSFPFKSVTGYTYDNGDYQTSLRRALELVNYNKWRLVQREEKSKEGGRLIGIGLSTYLEISSWGPGNPQTASITITMSGKVKVVSGTSPHGQGHETPLAQIVADELGIDIDNIIVTYGDTDRLPWGTVTGGSRSAALGGTAAMMSARKIKEKMAEIAAKELSVESSSLVFQGGKIFQRYNEQKSLAFDAVASMAYVPAKLPAGMEPTLFAYSAFAPEAWTFPYGTHVAIVEVEPETGTTKVLDYVAVDDIGVVINPMVAEGQVHGGVMQGAGQALLEGVIYDANGTFLSSSFMDYQIPEAEDSFPIRWSTTFTSTSANPLGVKGIGENGTVAAVPAIVNAVEDALSGVKIRTMPLTPEYVHGLLKASSKSG